MGMDYNQLSKIHPIDDNIIQRNQLYYVEVSHTRLPAEQISSFTGVYYRDHDMIRYAPFTDYDGAKLYRDLTVDIHTNNISKFVYSYDDTRIFSRPQIAEWLESTFGGPYMFVDVIYNIRGKWIRMKDSIGFKYYFFDKDDYYLFLMTWGI